MPLREVTNNVFQTTLNANALAGDLTLTLTTVAGLSTTAPFRLRIDDDAANFAGTYEVIYVTSVNVGANTVTVPASGGRGVDGTSGISHSIGAKVTAIATKGFWDGAYDPPYKGRAHQTVNQSIGTGAWTLIALDTKTGQSYDPNGNFDVVTNRSYTVPVSGYYMIAGSIQWTSPPGNRVATRIVKDTVVPLCTMFAFASATSEGAHVSDIQFLPTGAVLTLQGWHDAAGSLSTSAASETVFLAVHWLGS